MCYECNIIKELENIQKDEIPIVFYYTTPINNFKKEKKFFKSKVHSTDKYTFRIFYCKY